MTSIIPSKAKLTGAVPKRLTYEWTLYFVINADGTVQAKALKDSDEAGYAELEKGLIPAGEYRIGFVNKTGRDVEADRRVPGAQNCWSTQSLSEVRSPFPAI